MFLHSDADSFYTSVETVFRPDWRGKPIVALSSNDGTIIACNKAAKRLGVKKFVPFWQVRRFCEQNGVIVCSGNFALYVSLSRQMMSTYRSFAERESDFFVYSIDECFLKVPEGKTEDLASYGRLVRKTVYKNHRLVASVGIGPTLTLAKLATHFAKTNDDYAGVFVLRTIDDVAAMAKNLDVGEVWGIGRKTAAKLHALGVRTIWDLIHMPLQLIRTFSVELEKVVQELQSVPTKAWDECRADKKQVVSTSSLGRRIESKDELLQALCHHAGIAAQKARKQKLCWIGAFVFTSNSPFDPLYRSFNSVIWFDYPINDTGKLNQRITKQIENLFEEGVAYYRVGVGLTIAGKETQIQKDMFIEQETNPAKMKVLDTLNERFGIGTLFMASEGDIDKHSWLSRREYLTPSYITRWSDIPVIIS
ncbi:Y-family DNA polymerase (plasmid) [Shewanella xiamenensis]|uniref:Y-family DNA polymerase n=1 Tax=Shewanella xiamenensis TaxID=332186 RepID=A0ABT6UDS4_9GAMM|nr:Y-family DNA polymerase [Shewanella xiamenensis]MDI5832620.1 Y-family DNA polymerase [Shewanella xiamenensis]WHF57763.1 Y-family DNA polymerase [Shewanella xiamenensis]